MTRLEHCSAFWSPQSASRCISLIAKQSANGYQLHIWAAGITLQSWTGRGWTRCWVKHCTSYCLYVYTRPYHNMMCFLVFRHITNAAHLTCRTFVIFVTTGCVCSINSSQVKLHLDRFLLHIVIYRGYEPELLVRCTLLSVCMCVCVSLEQQLHPTALLTLTTGWQTHLSLSLRIVKTFFSGFVQYITTTTILIPIS